MSADEYTAAKAHAGAAAAGARGRLRQAGRPISARWKTPWGDINRFQRITGDIVQPFDDARPSIPVGFTSARWGSLASFGARAYPGTKKMVRHQRQQLRRRRRVRRPRAREGGHGGRRERRSDVEAFQRSGRALRDRQSARRVLLSRRRRGHTSSGSTIRESSDVTTLRDGVGQAFSLPSGACSMNRRGFIIGIGACVATSRFASAADAPRLTTFLDWQRASRDERERALQSLASRIRELDVPIHAWVQIAPETATGSGALDSIPFGVKDIIETKGLATEYRLAGLQGPHRHRRCGDRPRAAQPRRRGDGQDAHHLVRVSHAGPDAQPPRSGAHTRRQFERIGSSGRGRHDSLRARHANRWLDAAAGVVLRRHRVSNRPTAWCRSRACCRLPGASTRSASSRTRPPTCSRCGRRWATA